MDGSHTMTMQSTAHRNNPTYVHNILFFIFVKTICCALSIGEEIIIVPLKEVHLVV